MFATPSLKHSDIVELVNIKENRKVCATVLAKVVFVYVNSQLVILFKTVSEKTVERHMGKGFQTSELV